MKFIDAKGNVLKLKDRVEYIDDDNRTRKGTIVKISGPAIYFQQDHNRVIDAMFVDRVKFGMRLIVNEIPVLKTRHFKIWLNNSCFFLLKVKVADNWMREDTLKLAVEHGLIESNANTTNIDVDRIGRDDYAFEDSDFLSLKLDLTKKT